MINTIKCLFKSKNIPPQIFFYLKILFFIPNGRYVDCLSLTYATNKSKKLKSHYKYYIKRENKRKNIQSKYKSPNDKEQSQRQQQRRNEVTSPKFLSWPPSVAHILSYQIMGYSVLDGFCPWVRGGCIACSRGRGGFQCGEDVYPSSQPNANRNSAYAFLLGQSGILAVSCFHGFGDYFVSSSCLYTLWNTCFKYSLVEWQDVSLTCVCVILAPFLVNVSECSFPAIWGAKQIHLLVVHSGQRS